MKMTIQFKLDRMQFIFGQTKLVSADH